MPKQKILTIPTQADRDANDKDEPNEGWRHLLIGPLYWLQESGVALLPQGKDDLILHFYF